MEDVTQKDGRVDVQVRADGQARNPDAGNIMRPPFNMGPTNNPNLSRRIVGDDVNCRRRRKESLIVSRDRQPRVPKWRLWLTAAFHAKRSETPYVVSYN